LFVYSGPLTNPASLRLLACDVGSNLQSRVTFKFPPPGSGAGPYWLVVSGKGNTNGNLTAVIGYEPTLDSYGFNSSNQFGLTSSIAAPLSYRLLSATNASLPASAWNTILVTNLTTNSPYLRFTETNAGQTGQRYYRIAPANQ